MYFFLCPSFISITTNNQKKIEIKWNMTDPVRSKSWILFAYCHDTHWCHTNRADHIHKWQEQYHQNSFTIIMLMSYTVKSIKPTNIKCWLAFNLDETLTSHPGMASESLSQEEGPVTISQRLGFLCHSTPNWWVPSYVEGPVSRGEGKSSWLPEWPFLISVHWWRRSAGKEVHLENLQAIKYTQ